MNVGGPEERDPAETGGKEGGGASAGGSERLDARE